MSIEERIKALEILNEELKLQMEQVKENYKDHFVSSQELAEIMGCSVNNVYIKVREGKILSTKRMGKARIPMSQFYDFDVKEEKSKKSKKKEKTISKTSYNDMQELANSVFN